MGVQSATLAVGATSMSVTGGTVKTFSPDGVTVENGIHIVDGSATDFRVMKNITLKTRQPRLQTDGTYSKAIRKASLQIPKILASGKVVYTWVRVEIESSTENTDAEILDLRLLGAQLLSDSDFDNFYKNGSLA